MKDSTRGRTTGVLWAREGSGPPHLDLSSHQGHAWHRDPELSRTVTVVALTPTLQSLTREVQGLVRGHPGFCQTLVAACAVPTTTFSATSLPTTKSTSCSAHREKGIAGWAHLHPTWPGPPSLPACGLQV